VILDIELSVKTPLLGCKVVEGQPRKFLRAEDQRIAVIREIWLKHLTAAANDQELTFDPNALNLPLSIDVDKYELYTRTYNRVKKEKFESVPKGATIKFECTLFENKLDPTDFAEILATMGEWYGISQWGTKFGFGRFKVEWIRRKKLENRLDFELDLS